MPRAEASAFPSQPTLCSLFSLPSQGELGKRGARAQRAGLSADQSQASFAEVDLIVDVGTAGLPSCCQLERVWGKAALVFHPSSFLIRIRGL